MDEQITYRNTLRGDALPMGILTETPYIPALIHGTQLVIRGSMLPMLPCILYGNGPCSALNIVTISTSYYPTGYVYKAAPYSVLGLLSGG